VRGYLYTTVYNSNYNFYLVRGYLYTTVYNSNYNFYLVRGHALNKSCSYSLL